MKKGESMGAMSITGIGVHVKVSDIKKSREFYEGLGFKAVFGYGSDEYRATLPEGCPSAPERYNGITYEVSASAKLEIADGHLAVKPEVFAESIASPKVSAMVNVASIVPLFQDKKIEVKFPVRHYYWNSIEAVVRDPDGFVLVFIAPYSKEEFDALSKFIKVEVVKAPQ